MTDTTTTDVSVGSDNSRTPSRRSLLAVGGAGLALGAAAAGAPSP